MGYRQTETLPHLIEPVTPAQAGVALEKSTIYLWDTCLRRYDGQPTASGYPAIFTIQRNPPPF
ncbi:MAG: hypothetical protein RIG77_02950 [Cyclobacteriaceae bacterium]